MDSNIYMRMLLCEKVKLEPAFISKQYKDELLRRLKAKVEGLCTRHGYIKKESIDIHKVCVGRVEMIGLNGNTQYDVHFYADVCNPLLGSMIKCRVTNINKFGILAEADNIIEAIIAKNSVNIQSEVDLEKIRIGDDVLIEVVGKKYELNDKKISIVGKVVKDSASATASSTSKGLIDVQQSKNEDGDEGDEDYTPLDGGAESNDGESEEDDEDDDEEEVDDEDTEDKDDNDPNQENSDTDIEDEASGDEISVIGGGGEDGKFFSDDDFKVDDDYSGGSGSDDEYSFSDSDE